MAPGGRQPVRMETIKTQRLPALKKSHQVTTAVRKRQRSGKRFAHQRTDGTDAETSLPGGSVTVRGCSPDAVLGVGP